MAQSSRCNCGDPACDVAQFDATVVVRELREENERLRTRLRAVEAFVDRPQRLDSTAMNQLKSIVTGWSEGAW